jgi:hypothetical protein
MMCFANRKAQTGMKPEILMIGAFGIEAFENRFEFGFRDARALIFNGDGDAAFERDHKDGNVAAGGRKGQRVGEQVLKYLAYSLLHTQYKDILFIRAIQ